MAEPAIQPPSDSYEDEESEAARDAAEDPGYYPAMPERAIEPPFICEAIGCERLADWALIEGERVTMCLCEFHGGTADVDGWVRINHE